MFQRQPHFTELPVGSLLNARILKDNHPAAAGDPSYHVINFRSGTHFPDEPKET